MANIAIRLGQPFMPWQQMVADTACEYDVETGIPFYREVIVTVPRQSGKSTLVFVWQLDRSLSDWGGPQHSVFTAQTGKDARDKWMDEFIPLLQGSQLAPFVEYVHVGFGNEVISFRPTGSMIRLLSTSAWSGHSRTLDQAAMDEIWNDTDDRREQGLRPAMVTRPKAQLFVTSTAGTQASTVLNRKVRTGRLAVDQDSGHGIAYFEWSAPDDWDPDDEDSYFSFMPALCPDPPCRCGEGWKHTITLDVVRNERLAMKPEEFLRAYGNRPTGAVDRMIPLEVWREVCDPAVSPKGPLRFGVDVAPDRSSAAICASDGKTIELVEHRPGTGWLVGRANELAARHDTDVSLDVGGPAGLFAGGIERCYPMPSREVIEACGAMFDAIVDAKVKFRSHTAFDQAMAGVVPKPVGDRWVWSRKGSMVDVTPLMAATLAYAHEPVAALEPLMSWR